MAFNSYILNQFPTTYGQALSMVVEMLVSAGWTYRASGDGLSGYNATGKVFTSTGAGALGWNNSGAWARVRDPSGVRELVFQHDAATGLKIKVSPTAVFTIGGSSTTPPTASDERYIAGTAAAYYTTFFSTGILKGSTLFQGAALAQYPYGFWFASARYPKGGLASGFMMDPVQSVAEDLDPYVYTIGREDSTNNYPAPIFSSAFFASSGVSYGAPNLNSVSSTTFQGCFAFMDPARTKFLTVKPCGYSLGNIGSASAIAMYDYGLQANPFNGKLDSLPIPYIRYGASDGTTNSTLGGLKGWSTFAKWTGTQRATFTDTMNNKQFICVGAMWLPWDGTTTPLS